MKRFLLFLIIAGFAASCNDADDGDFKAKEKYLQSKAQTAARAAKDTIARKR